MIFIKINIKLVNNECFVIFNECIHIIIAHNVCNLVPKLNIGDSETGYHGLVKENETLVEVTPPIRATGAEICSFKIVNKHHGDVPFEVCFYYLLTYTFVTEF